MTASASLLESVNRSFDAAAAFGKYPPGLLEQIKICNSVYRFHFPIRKEGGRLRGHRGVARRAQPPQAPDQGRHPLRARCGRGRGSGARGADDLQVRGRRRAVRRRQGRHPDRSRKRPVEQLERITRRYAARADQEELHRPRRSTCLRRTTAPAEREMAWIVDTYSAFNPGEIDALGVRHGQAGHPGRHSRPRARRPGAGVFFGIREACGVAEDMTAARADARPRRASESSCRDSATSATTRRGFCRKAGADHRRARGVRGGDRESRRARSRRRSSGIARTRGSITGFPGARDLSSSGAALELDCDVSSRPPSRTCITRDNAARIRAQIVAEAANGPTTADADEILRSAWRAGHTRHLPQRGRRDGVLLRVAEEPLPRPVRPNGKEVRRIERARDGAGDREHDGKASLRDGPQAADPGSRRGGPRQLRPGGDHDRRAPPDSRSSDR